MVEVEPGVLLEVLDWGGPGEPMVFLTGLGDNAHVFDNFAYQFTDRYRVLGITRRGFGRSSQPVGGYDVATRAADDVAVLDALGLERAIFVGHSMAGDELSALGASHAERVSKLVYLDAYDYGVHSTLPQPPGPEYTDRDVQSLENYAAAYARYYGSREPEAAMRDTYRLDASGALVGPVSPPEITEKMKLGSRQADFAAIKAPTLAIFAPLAAEQPFYYYLDSAQKAEYDRTFPPILAWQQDALRRFREGVRNARIIELPGAYHYLYITNEAFVVQEMNRFLKEGP